MRPWQAIILVLLLAFFSISSGWHVLYILTYVLLTLFILSWLWARYSLSKLVFRRSSTAGRVQVGETFDERLMLDNVGLMPKLWVQVADGSTLPGHRAGYVASMGGRKRATWRNAKRLAFWRRWSMKRNIWWIEASSNPKLSATRFGVTACTVGIFCPRAKHSASPSLTFATFTPSRGVCWTG